MPVREGAERLHPERVYTAARPETVGITTRAEEAPSPHILEQAVMQGLSQAPASVCGENCEFDDVEVAANPLRGDRLWKRVTQQIRPVLATLTGVPPGVPGDAVVVFLRQHQSVPRALRVLLEEIQVPRVVVREVITEAETVENGSRRGNRRPAKPALPSGGAGSFGGRPWLVGA